MEDIFKLYGIAKPVARQPKKRLSEDEEQQVTESLGQKALGTVGAVGNALDLPGSVVRDLATWLPGGMTPQNPVDQFLTPFNDSNRVSGRELNRSYGLAKGEDTWANFAGGLGTEVALDPLTYLTLGASALSRGGQVARAAGLMKQAPAAFAKKAGRNLGTVGAREARVGTTLKELIDFLGPEAKAAAETAAKGKKLNLDDLMDQKLGGNFGINLPFSDPFAVVGSNQKLAQKLDKFGRDIRFAKIPGTDFAPMNFLHQTFDARAGAMDTPLGVAMAEKSFDAKTANRSQVDLVINRMANQLKELGYDDATGGRLIRKMMEVEKYRANAPKELTPLLDEMQSVLEAMPAEAKQWGINLKEYVDDDMSYFPRQYTREVRNNAGSGKSQVVNARSGNRVRRKEFLFGMPEGTDPIIDLAKDEDVNRLLEGGAGIKEVRDLIEQKYNHLIPATYEKTLKTGSKAGEVVTRDRFKALARWLGTLSPEGRKSGVFGNHALYDLQARMVSAADGITASKTIVDFLSQPEVMQTSSSAVLKQGMTVNQLLKRVGLNIGDETGGVGMQLALKQGHDLAAMGPDVAKKVIESMGKARVSEELAQDITKYMESFRNPEHVGKFLDTVNNVTNFWKGSLTTPWPSFHVRNLISGQWANASAGLWSPDSMADTAALVRGKVVKGASKIPAVQQEWAKRQQGALAKQLTDEEATRILGEMAAAYKVIGKFDASDTAGLGASIDNQLSHNLEDMLSGIPGVGRKSFSTSRVAKKAVAMEKGTSLKPWANRGIGGRTKSEFGPMAAGEEVGFATESMNRIAPWIHQLKQGVDPQHAADRVGAIQVQYGNRYYTKTEQQVLGNLFPFYKFCVPTDHEILTRNGWKTHDQLSVGEEVLAFDIHTEELRWEPIQSIHVFPHTGKIQVYRQKRKTKVIEFKFTDDHRWPVSSRIRTRKKSNASVTTKSTAYTRTIKRAFDLTDEDRLYRTGRFLGTESVLSERHAAILGWIVTDGYMRNKSINGRDYWEAVIYQSPKKHLNEIIELTGSSPRRPHPETGVVPVNVKADDLKTITSAIKQYGGIVGVVTHLSRSVAEAMQSAMMKAEGTVYQTGREMFYQYSKNEVLDAFQILCLMIERSANLCQQGCTVSRKKYYTHIPSHSTFEDFDGHVWCPVTPSGTWIMRNNGDVVITGNTRGVTPYLIKQIMEHPGGAVANTIRTMKDAHDPATFTPDHITESAAIPINGELENIFGKVPAGHDRYVSGLGLPVEDMLGFGPSPRGAMLEVLSRMNPVIKGPLEYATGQSLFQKTPTGGRPIGDLDPLTGRLAANLIGSPDPVRFPGQSVTDMVLANSPLSKALGTANLFTDTRRTPTEKAINFLTGIRTKDVTPATKDAMERDALKQAMRDLQAKDFVRTYIPESVRAKMSPEEAAKADQYEALMAGLADRAKARKEAMAEEEARLRASK